MLSWGPLSASSSRSPCRWRRSTGSRRGRNQSARGTLGAALVVGAAPARTARAVLFAQLVDDPSSHPDRFPTLEAQRAERDRLHAIIERLVVWENTSDEGAARRGPRGDPEVDGRQPATDPRPVCRRRHDSARSAAAWSRGARLGPQPSGGAHNKALIEIPPKFAGRRPSSPGSTTEDRRLGGSDRARRRRARVWPVDARRGREAHR